MTRTVLVTSAQVLRDTKFNSAAEAGGSDIISDAIEEARDEVLGDYGDPPKRSTFWIDSNQTEYEFRVDKKKTYAVEKVYIIDGNNNRIEYSQGTASEANKEYTLDTDFNKITFASGTVSARNGERVVVDYIPNQIHWLARLKADLYVLDRTATTNSEENTPTEGLRIVQRITRIEKSIEIDSAVGSSDERFYDPTYGDIIPQRRFVTY